VSRTLIIGYGNPLRGDDAFGWRVTDRLRGILADPEIEVLTVHQLTPELMDPVSSAALVIFVDACEGREPGALIERRMEPLPGGAAAFTHHATPEALVAGARALYGRAAEAVMVSVAGADFSLGAELSPPVHSRLDEAVSVVLRLAGA
jgi:hydrogenase maturation protease